jgi:asparagine synthase (glutamine-hydrolysing)
MFMCGIAGIISLDSKDLPQLPELQQMAKQLRHRGPDGEGFYCQNAIGLAHTRLSIIDLTGGTQPIHNEDKTIWTIFNGEIFNYLELRELLVARGHIFYTHSDTEVLVHLYEEYGDDFLQHLNGQFALAIWDLQQQKLLLARDRVGITPLFYTQKKGRLIFASEIKAILAALDQSSQMNLQAFNQLLYFWAPVSPESIFDGIQSLSPGHLLTVNLQDAEIKIKKYWDWQFPEEKINCSEKNESKLCEELHDLLVDATQIRLRADVPVGAYLSGGLDSSVLLALIRRHTQNRTKSFSLGFSEASHDESTYQTLVADYLQTDNSRVLCKPEDIAREFLPCIWNTESPLLRTAAAPMRILSQLVRNQGYKVVLTGEGSDEVFGGYDIFKEAKVRHFWAANPQSNWRAGLLKRLYPYLDISGQRASQFLAPFFGQGLDKADAWYFSHLPRWDMTAKAKMFLSPEISGKMQNALLEDLQSTLPDEIENWSLLQKGQYIEAKTLMSGYLLSSQGDRMLMANSVEGRFPFLDHRVIEFANRLPVKLKLKVLKEKYILRKTMSQYLPAEIIHRQKQPYRAPDAIAFFQNGQATAEYMDDLLSDEKISRYGYFDLNKVKLLLKKARAGNVSSTKDNQSLVMIISTQIWHYHFVENFLNFKR